MDWIKSFQKAVDYVEEHICEPVDYKRIAQEMNVSSFYFQKIFSILCGFTVGEYIRSRRLALAGSELLSPEGFTRAFARFHGITPSDVRKNGAPVRSFARLSVSISVKGGSSMDYKIMKKEAFKIIAKEQRFKKVEDIQGRSDIPAFWTECHGDGTVKYLSENCKKDGILGGSVVGMCMEDSTVVKDFPYLIGAEYAGVDVPNGYKVVDVPAAEWAVFGIDGLGEEKIQQTWHKIFAEFFPSSTYKPAGNFDLEVYPTDTYKGEIWISVEKKG